MNDTQLKLKGPVGNLHRSTANEEHKLGANSRGQAYERADSRGKNSHPPRPPRQPGVAAAPKKHYPKPASSKVPAQTASIVMTRAFRVLIEAAGAENLALALDLNLSRIAELDDRERFTAETAFHTETALGLLDEYFYQPNAVLTSATIARLRAMTDLTGLNETSPIAEGVAQDLGWKARTGRRNEPQASCFCSR